MNRPSVLLCALAAVTALVAVAAPTPPAQGQTPKRGGYENYKCGSSRNYTDCYSEETDRLIDQQSQELEPPRTAPSSAQPWPAPHRQPDMPGFRADDGETNSS